METIISFIMAFIAAFGLYPRTGYIVELEPQPEDMYKITIEDATGNLWVYDTDADDYTVGDGVAMIMYNNDTPESIYDDVIISARYSGFWR